MDSRLDRIVEETVDFKTTLMQDLERLGQRLDSLVHERACARRDIESILDLGSRYGVSVGEARAQIQGRLYAVELLLDEVCGHYRLYGVIQGDTHRLAWRESSAMGNKR